MRLEAEWPGRAIPALPLLWFLVGLLSGGEGLGINTHPSWPHMDWQRKGAWGWALDPGYQGGCSSKSRTLRLLLTVEVGPCPHGVRRRAGGWQALWGRLQAPRTHCLVRAAHRRVYREVGNGGYSWASIFALSCAASIPKVTPTSGPKVAAAAPDITPAPRLSGRRSVKAPPPPFTDTPGKRHCHV